uniref:Uncharacterized protein n=1 Tax=Candidatus Kentrum sp. SD TaxID=2126332 RepID=A0A450YC72_9GAMM|nr:MAG: hypothetical protein BECKSD772E_GA0070983_100218 [Candidatus Kentron sp. SD]
MKILCVPIRVDALVATDKTPVIGPGADFSALPYQNEEEHDIRFDTANLVSSIRKEPFRNEGALRPGVHLHWALPDALTHGVMDDDGNLDMPAAPNRWLVTRVKGAERKSWIVESDYLYPAGIVPDRAVCIPYKAKSGEPPWRYLGRQLALSRWRSEERQAGASHERYSGLHVLGWGNPWFSALYAECFSVFGCYDEEKTDAASVAGAAYEVFGWHADAGDDYLLTRIKAKVDDSATLQEVAESVAKWKIEGDASDLDRMICFGRVEFSDAPRLDDGIDPDKSTVAMARSGGEAIAAWVSKMLTELEGGEEDESLRIENQIEAVLFNDRVRGENVDFINRLKTARHRDEFNPVDGGSLWAFIEESAIETNDEGKTEESKKALRGLKEDKRSELARLNTLQEEANRATLAIGMQQQLLYADWTKYMLARYPTDRLNDDYPDGDLIRHFMETRTLPELSRLERLKKNLDTDITTIKTELDGALKTKLAALDIPSDDSTTLLRPIPGPRYWRAKEPSLLIAGDVAAPSQRHGRDGESDPDGNLPCQVREISEENLDRWAESNQPITQLDWDGMARNEWSKTPWSPLFLEWRMALYPDREAIARVEGNLEPYDPGFIARHYRIPLNDAEFSLPSASVDLQPRGGGRGLTTSRSPNIVAGRTVLTFGVKQVVGEELADYLEEKLEEKGKQDFAAYLARENKTEGDGFEDPIYTIGKATGFLDKSPCMTQRLDGLHDEWLMQRSGLALPVADPFRFLFEKDESEFTRRVKGKLGGRNYKLPSPYHRFTPIRSGVDKLMDVRVIDSFGRFKDIPCDDILRPQRELAGSTVCLPPRLIPPVRLNFRWRMHGAARGAAGTESPILGWLLYNLFDETLVFYDTDGKPLGDINSDGEWTNRQGLNDLELSDIRNGLLKRFVGQILTSHNRNRVGKDAFLAKGGTDSLWNTLVEHRVLELYDDGKKDNDPTAFTLPLQTSVPEETSNQWRNLRGQLPPVDEPNYLPALKRAIRRAQDNIDPEGVNSDQMSQAGRPLAIVRAQLDLQLLGAPDVSKSWGALRSDLSNNGRSRRRFTQVRFPIKIGEFRNLDDGVIAYWPEEESGELSRLGYFPQSDMADIASDVEGLIDAASFDPDDHDFIDEVKLEGVANLSLALDDPPLNLTMLVEPDGWIHATTGIVPKKRLVLEPTMYRQALSEIEYSFFAAPLLTPSDRCALPLPPEGPWRWTQRAGDGIFTEVPGVALIDRAKFLEAYGEDGTTTWDKLIQEKILLPYAGKNGEQGDFAFHRQIPADQVPASLKDDWETIQKAFAKGRAPSVRPLATVPPLTAPARAVEGWVEPMKFSEWPSAARAEGPGAS